MRAACSANSSFAVLNSVEVVVVVALITPIIDSD
jgi:hypothetical protein